VRRPPRVLVEVWCYRCRQEHKSPVATVYRSREGLVFEGIVPVGMRRDVRRELTDALDVGKRPWPHRYLAVGVVKVLLERPLDEDSDWPPRASCAVHGIAELGPNDLIAAAREAEVQRGRATKSYIHR
jgi:hypothetical protein